MTVQKLLSVPPARPEPIRATNFVSSCAKRRIDQLIASGELSKYYGGEWCHRFEQEFARYHGHDLYAVAVNSGTSALHLAIAACGIGAGDEVIVPALSFVAAATIVAQNGALPVVCDVEPRSLTLDPNCVRNAITNDTKAVVVVHYRGYPADLVALRQLCDKYDLFLVEDCAQSFGARAQGELTGSYGDFSAFSFSTNKHVACGEGGMVLCRTKERSDLLRQKSNYGKGPAWDDFRMIGFNYRLPEFSAIVGLDSLSRGTEEIARRIAAAELYRTAVADSEYSVVPEPLWGQSSFFRCPIQLPRHMWSARKAIADALAEKHVTCWIPHPPLHTIPWLRDYLSERGFSPAEINCPVAERASRQLVEIETGPNLPKEEAEKTAEILWNLAR